MSLFDFFKKKKKIEFAVEASSNHSTQEQKSVNISSLSTPAIPESIEKCTVSIRTKTSTMIPPLQGDYAKTIFLYVHRKAHAIRQDNYYQQYLIYECGIRNPFAYHKQMLDEGYFENAPFSESLKSLKVVELKTILEKIGQKKAGKKEELIQRIVGSSTYDDIKGIFSLEVQYCLSQKGIDFLEAHNDYVLIHKHHNLEIDWKEYDKTKAKLGKEYSFYDVVWTILNQRILNSSDYGRSEYLNMYQLLLEERKNKQALEMLLRVVHNDLSGVAGMWIYDSYLNGYFTKAEAIDDFNIAFLFAPSLLVGIKDLSNFYSEDMVEKIYENKLPVNICPKPMFLKFVHTILEGTFSLELFQKELKSLYIDFVNSLKK